MDWHEKKVKQIYKKRNNLTPTQILQELANIGLCPCLIFDDNGYWALHCEGIQNIRIKADEDLHTEMFILAKAFKPSIEY